MKTSSIPTPTGCRPAGHGQRYAVFTAHGDGPRNGQVLDSGLVNLCLLIVPRGKPSLNSISSTTAKSGVIRIGSAASSGALCPIWKMTSGLIASTTQLAKLPDSLA